MNSKTQGKQFFRCMFVVYYQLAPYTIYAYNKQVLRIFFPLLKWLIFFLSCIIISYYTQFIDVSTLLSRKGMYITGVYIEPKGTVTA